MITAKNTIELVSKDFSKNSAYLCAKWASFGNANITEITENGNIEIISLAPKICANEIINYQKEYPLYFFEKANLGAILLDKCKIEMTINPSYYDDDRFSQLLKKDTVHVHCFLVDSACDELVATNAIEINGKALDNLKKCLSLNATATIEQYNKWIDNVLYRQSFKKNIEMSIYIGKGQKVENEILVY